MVADWPSDRQYFPTYHFYTHWLLFGCCAGPCHVPNLSILLRVTGLKVLAVIGLVRSSLLVYSPRTLPPTACMLRLTQPLRGSQAPITAFTNNTSKAISRPASGLTFRPVPYHL